MNIQGITPNVAAPMQAQSVSSPRTASDTTSSANTGMLGGTNLQDTFLSLLVTELQNQDPTSPVDPTQMVGQMVSLNQLDQLIAMNQTLTTMANGATTPADSSSPRPQARITESESSNSGNLSNPPLAGVQVNTQTQPSYQVPMDSNSMMNLYGSVGTMGVSSH